MIPVFLLLNVVYLLSLLSMNSILILTLPLVFLPALAARPCWNPDSSSSLEWPWGQGYFCQLGCSYLGSQAWAELIYTRYLFLLLSLPLQPAVGCLLDGVAHPTPQT